MFHFVRGRQKTIRNVWQRVELRTVQFPDNHLLVRSEQWVPIDFLWLWWDLRRHWNHLRQFDLFSVWLDWLTENGVSGSLFASARKTAPAHDLSPWTFLTSERMVVNSCLAGVAVAQLRPVRQGIEG